jgi:hypothetical protein
MAKKRKPLHTLYLLATAVPVAFAIAVGWSQWSIRQPEHFPPMEGNAALAVEHGRAQAAGHGWLRTLEEGKAQARTSGKPLMVVLRCEP